MQDMQCTIADFAENPDTDEEHDVTPISKTMETTSLEPPHENNNSLYILAFT